MCFVYCCCRILTLSYNYDMKNSNIALRRRLFIHMMVILCFEKGQLQKAKDPFEKFHYIKFLSLIKSQLILFNSCLKFPRLVLFSRKFFWKLLLIPEQRPFRYSLVTELIAYGTQILLYVKVNLPSQNIISY